MEALSRAVSSKDREAMTISDLMTIQHDQTKMAKVMAKQLMSQEHWEHEMQTEWIYLINRDTKLYKSCG